MIHVDPRPEPAGFDSKVRQKGLAFLERKNIPLDIPLPPKTGIQPYWRACLDDLYSSYRGICAYMGIHFERATGAGTVDHFIAKSKRAGLAYEWSNYRLACSSMNSRKRDFDDVLDPFEVDNGWFQLELLRGTVFPAAGLPDDLKRRVRETIERLGLDDPVNREMRARRWHDYIVNYVSEEALERYSPFVWYEARRQGLL